MSRIEPKVTSVYPPAAPAELPHQQIALRAYSKWLERGCPQGESECDWHAAVAELAAETAPSGHPRSVRKNGKSQRASQTA